MCFRGSTAAGEFILTNIPMRQDDFYASCFDKN